MDDLLLWSLPALGVLLGLEARHSVRRRDETYAAEDSVASVLVGVGHLWASAGWRLLHLPLLWLAWRCAPLHVPLESAWAWVALFLLGDLAAYVTHRASHDVGLLWASHVVHHTSPRYNLGTSLRLPWTAGLFDWAFWLPLAFLGFHPGAILVVQAVQALHHFALHAAYVGPLGPLEHVLNTPTHHRLHHAREPELRESNFGSILIVWDRLLGTFAALDDEEPAEYGLPRSPPTHNPLAIAFHGWLGLLAALWRARGSEEVFDLLAGGPCRGRERLGG